MEDQGQHRVFGLQLVSISLLLFVFYVLLWISTYFFAAAAWLGPDSLKSLAPIIQPSRLVAGVFGFSYLMVTLLGKFKCRLTEGPGKAELLASIALDAFSCLLFFTPLGALAPLPAGLSLLFFLGYLYRLGAERELDWLQNQSQRIGLGLVVAYGLGVFLRPIGAAVATLVAVGCAVSLFHLLKKTKLALTP